MSLQRGDVVMVDWTYNDRTGSKVRPAIVTQADFLNRLIADTVLIAVTRTTRKATSTEVVLDPALEPASGLRYVSIASCNNLLTLDQALVRQVIGHLSDPTMQRIDQAVKTALDLP